MADGARERYDELYQSSLSDPETFWLEAADRLVWTRRPERAFEPRERSSFTWFPGGRTNLAVNALDRHVSAGRGETTALIALDERGGRRAFTYAELLAEVERVAAGLRGLGIGKGDRLTIYMPTSAEAIIAMLATVRIGAIHCVVFAGFGAGALGDRIRASGSRLVLTTDVTYRKGKDVDLLSIVDDAIDAGPSDVEHVVVLQRSAASRPRRDGELAWDEVLKAGEGQSAWRVWSPRRLDGRLGLRASAGRDVVVDVGHRLGRGPQLHRLCPVDGRHRDARV
jgi:acetyl-CoA synthetase